MGPGEPSLPGPTLIGVERYMVHRRARSRANCRWIALLIGILTLATHRTGGQEAADQTVILHNILFNPTQIEASVGEKIEFINQDAFEHDVYLVRTANLNIALIEPTIIKADESVIVTIDQEGLFTLFCTIHGGMRGILSTTGSFELSEEEKAEFAHAVVIPPIVHTGEELFWGRAQCFRCHQLGERGEGLRGPNLQDIGFRAKITAGKLGMDSATDYISQSILDPSAQIVEGFSDDMPKVYQPPINLTDGDITAIVTYLQSQGGEVDTWSIDIDESQLDVEILENPFRHGDPIRGALVYETMGCGSCHTVAERRSISVGPELTAIGAYRNWIWLAESVIDPNAEIGANWQYASVYLKPGVSAGDEEAGAEFTEEDFEEDFDEDFEEDFDEGVSASESRTKPSSTVATNLAQARADLERIRSTISRLEKQQASLHDEIGRSAFEDRGQADRRGTAADRENPDDLATPAELEPDEAVAEQEEPFEFGASIEGILRHTAPDEITLLLTSDQSQTFKTDQIARIRPSELSKMPSNYGELLTLQQMADLIRYLESLKGPEAQEPSE